jgi:hypothetical protein
MSGVTSHWFADEDVLACIQCRDKFTITKRKHHCRNCGGVFCASCTNKKVTLPKLGFESFVRVCDNCYRQRMNAPAPATPRKEAATTTLAKSSSTGSAASTTAAGGPAADDIPGLLRSIRVVRLKHFLQMDF